MRNIEFIPKDTIPNKSPKAKKIKLALEKIGHTNVLVWWENIGMAVEMCGHSGGYMFISDQLDYEMFEALGLSFDEAIDTINTSVYIRCLTPEDRAKAGYY